MSDGEWLFSDSEDELSDVSKTVKAYKLLIVDDEPGVHEVTKMALRQFEFNGAKLNIISAYSGKEAKEVIESNPDISVILLDVVMETSDAGLQVADWVRNVYKNHKVRIVLRTGQPGEAPESEIMTRYDINDYKEKTELTNRKLKTLMYACLRGYNDIVTIERVSSKLKTIVESSNTLFKVQTGEQFSRSVIELLGEILMEDHTIPPTRISSITCKNKKIVYATGAYELKNGEDYSTVCDSDVFDLMIESGEDGIKVFDQEIYVYLKSEINEFMIYVENLNVVEGIDADILSLFFKHVSVGYKNIEDSFS